MYVDDFWVEIVDYFRVDKIVEGVVCDFCSVLFDVF